MHDHQHYGSYEKKHRKFHEADTDNLAITISSNEGYGNDVVKYIKDHNMDTLSSMGKNANITISSFSNIETTTMHTKYVQNNDVETYYTTDSPPTTNIPFNQNDYLMEETSSDPFLGYDVLDEDYYGWL